MKISKQQLKELVKQVVREEDSEYQVFFQKALEKTGKSIPEMSDEEKKDFFNKIDAAWDGKGEKNEVNEAGKDFEGKDFKVGDRVVVKRKGAKDKKGKVIMNPKNMHTWYGGVARKAGTFKLNVKGILTKSDDISINGGNNPSGEYFYVPNDWNEVVKESVNEASDAKKRFMFDFYTDSNQRNTERETNFLATTLESAIKAAEHICKVTGYAYVEIYYKDLFLGSMKKQNGFKFVEGRGYSKYKSVNEASQPGEWVAFLGTNKGKKLLKVFNTARGANQFMNKNMDKLLDLPNVERVGTMSKSEWDKREAKYAIESVNEEEIRKGSTVVVMYPTLRKPITGKVVQVLKSAVGTVYVLDDNKGVWDAKYITASVPPRENKEPLKEGVTGYKLLLNVSAGHTNRIEGIKVSKQMADTILDWMQNSPYGKKYGKQLQKVPFGSILKPLVGPFGIKKRMSSDLNGEFKRLAAHVENNTIA